MGILNCHLRRLGLGCLYPGTYIDAPSSWLWPGWDAVLTTSMNLNSQLSTEIGLLSQVTYTAGKYDMKTTQSNNEGH